MQRRILQQLAGDDGSSHLTKLWAETEDYMVPISDMMLDELRSEMEITAHTPYTSLNAKTEMYTGIELTPI